MVASTRTRRVQRWPLSYLRGTQQPPPNSPWKPTLLAEDTPSVLRGPTAGPALRKRLMRESCAACRPRAATESWPEPAHCSVPTVQNMFGLWRPLVHACAFQWQRCGAGAVPPKQQAAVAARLNYSPAPPGPPWHTAVHTLSGKAPCEGEPTMYIIPAWRAERLRLNTAAASSPRSRTSQARDPPPVLLLTAAATDVSLPSTGRADALLSPRRRSRPPEFERTSEPRGEVRRGCRGARRRHSRAADGWMDGWRGGWHE
eukprot:scaffold1224_cov392-Prasinococcus_capsulatus_cf.AAC.2